MKTRRCLQVAALALTGAMTAAAAVGADGDKRAASAEKKYAPPETFESVYARESRDRPADLIRHYRDLAYAGSCQAAARLGQIHEQSLLGIRSDPEEAGKWFGAARKFGCGADTSGEPLRTATGMGFHLAETLAREGNGPEAVRAYAGAAKSGQCEAAQRLGAIYEQGLIGVPRDDAAARNWYGIAAALGCDVPDKWRKSKEG